MSGRETTPQLIGEPNPVPVMVRTPKRLVRIGQRWCPPLVPGTVGPPAPTVNCALERDVHIAGRRRAHDVAIYASRLTKDGTKWEKPRVIQDVPDKSEGNPVVWYDGKGVLLAFYVTII